MEVKVDETVKYGGIVYHRDDELLAGIFAYKNHASLELGKGSEIDDTYSVLEGKGKHRRHIKFQSVADVNRKHTRHYLKAALG